MRADSGPRLVLGVLALSVALAACGANDSHPLVVSDSGTHPRDAGAGQSRDAGNARDASPAGCDGHCAERAGPREAASDAPSVHPSLDAATGSSPDATPVAPDAAVDVPPGYPVGPYGGRAVGDVLGNLKWEGYVNDTAAALSSTEPYVPYSLDDLHRSGKALLLLHVADFDCAGCKSAAADLVKLGAAVVEAGGAVVEVLGSQGWEYVATRPYLDAWLATYDLRVTSVIDAPGHGLETLHVFGIRETSVIVDLTTMQIVWKMNGDVGGVDPSSIIAAAAEMHLRLGQ